MLITAINKGKKHTAEIVFSAGESLIIDYKTAYNRGLYVGKELSDTEIKGLMRESNCARALSRGVWYIERGSLSVKLLQDKLYKAEFPEYAVNYATEKLLDYGLLNDAALAENLAKALKDGNISKFSALQKMQQKGLPRDIAAAALDAAEYNPEDQIKALIDKKYAARLETPEGLQKTVAALLRRGFRYGDIRSALKQYQEEIEFCED